jgi:hypothetical protein
VSSYLEVLDAQRSLFATAQQALAQVRLAHCRTRSRCTRRLAAVRRSRRPERRLATMVQRTKPVRVRQICKL